MNKIADFTRDLSDGRKTTPEELAQMRCDWYNALPGELKYLNCEKCKNKGYIARLDEELNEIRTECNCMNKRRSIKNLELSGLGSLIRRYTFKAFETPEEWQSNVKKKALLFTENSAGSWFYAAGQSGSGKTHICTAICTRLIADGHIVKYKIWRELFHELQSNQFDDSGYKNKIKDLCAVDVLYIDDFLKSNSNNAKFSDELNFAFEIINKRYNANKKTIISSELLISDIQKYDSALAGRIAEKAAGFMVQIQKDENKNYRLKDRDDNAKMSMQDL